MKQMYYSEVLHKYFETEDECVKAEKQHKEIEKEKAEAKALVKKESSEVNDAFIERNKARKDYNEKLLAAHKVYCNKVREAQEEYNKVIEEISKVKDEAEDNFQTKLQEFNKNHPEGFRLTLKDGDNVVTYYNATKFDTTWTDALDKVIESFTSLRFPW